MMSCAALHFLLVLLVTFTDVSGLNQDSPSSNCTIVDEGKVVSEDAFIGWPYHLKCNLFASQTEYTIYDVYDNGDVDYDSDIICQFYSENGALLLNESSNYEDLVYYDGPRLELGEIEANGSYNFRMNIITILSQRCFEINVSVIPKPFHETTCEQFVANATNNKFSSDIGRSKSLPCELGHSDNPRIFTSNLTTAWFRNCSTLPGDTTATNTSKLLIPSVDYEHAGIYTCSVTYKGMTRFITTYGVCVSESPTFSPHTMQCDKTVFAGSGKNASISCQLRLGFGQFSHFHFRVFWKKQSSDIGESCRREPSNDRFSCSYEYQPTCYLHIAETHERNRTEQIIPITLNIRDVSPTDYGTYIVSTITANSNSEKVEQLIELKQNKVPNLLQAAEIAGIVAVIAVVIIAALVVVIMRNKRNKTISGMC
ncbi:uncharacterized protein LOC143471193 [Clavelina lepadiformis]|uniref:uncharacterized protein LOC143471193 n=1 Tax=Clavelina lepadiformis TaxID=159417 RepID=UPI00404193F3